MITTAFGTRTFPTSAHILPSSSLHCTVLDALNPSSLSFRPLLLPSTTPFKLQARLCHVGATLLHSNDWRVCCSSYHIILQGSLLVSLTKTRPARLLQGRWSMFAKPSTRFVFGIFRNGVLFSQKDCFGTGSGLSAVPPLFSLGRVCLFALLCKKLLIHRKTVSRPITFRLFFDFCLKLL